MLAGRLLLAIGQSAAIPAMASLLVDCFSARSRSTAIGVYLASYNCALIVAGKFGGRVADTATWRVAPFGADGWYLDVAGWRMAHFLFAALGGSAAIVLFFGLREPRRTRPAGKADSILPLGGALLSVVRIPSWWVIALVFTLTGITINTVQFWLPRYLHDHFHLKLEDAGLLATLWIQSATIIGLLAGGKLGDRMATWGFAGRTALQSVGLAALIPALLAIGTSDRRMALIAAMVVYGFGVGVYQANLWAATFEVVRPATRATSVGLLNLTSGTLGFWSDPVIGAVHETVGGLGHVIAALGVPIAGSVLLLGVNMLWLLRRDHLRSPMG
jgi:MFS family permease